MKCDPSTHQQAAVEIVIIAHLVLMLLKGILQRSSKNLKIITLVFREMLAFQHVIRIIISAGKLSMYTGR